MTRRALYYAIHLLFTVALLIAVWMFARNRNPSGAMGQANIDQTSCVYCSIGKTDKLALVVWVDEPDRSPPRGMGGTAPFQGRFARKGGGEVTWTCSSHDGKTGKVEVAGQTYDLEQGGLSSFRPKMAEPRSNNCRSRPWAAQYRAHRKNLKTWLRLIRKSPPSLTPQKPNKNRRNSSS